MLYGDNENLRLYVRNDYRLKSWKTRVVLLDTYSIHSQIYPYFLHSIIIQSESKIEPFHYK